MKNIILIFAILAIFAFSYLIIKKLNRLLNENRHWISAAETGDCSTIRISAEGPNLLNSIEPFFTSYSDTHPHIVIRFGYGNAQALLKKLTRGSIHIILLSEKPAKDLPSNLACFQIPLPHTPIMPHGIDMSDPESIEEAYVYVLWNSSIESHERDRLLFVLENAHCHSTCGYCDYLD